MKLLTSGSGDGYTGTETGDLQEPNAFKRTASKMYKKSTASIVE